MEKKNGATISKEFLLYNPTRKVLLQRVILDQEGDEAASISYSGWQNTDNCPLPTILQVSGISFGATINVEMKDIITDHIFSKDTFYLKLSPGYMRQHYP